MKYLHILLVVILFCIIPISNIVANELKSVTPSYHDKTSTHIKINQKIPSSVINTIKPTIKDWLEFYHLDISKFYIRSIGYSHFEKKNQGIYSRKFDPAVDDVYIPQMYDYSPSKQKYIKYLPIEKKVNKYIFLGNDDSQEIYLVDRKSKLQKIILWFGTTHFLEAVFWQDEDNLIAVGLYYPDNYFIYTLGPNDKIVEYYYKSKPEHFKGGYFLKNLKTRGVSGWD